MELRGTLELFSKIHLASTFLLRKICSQNPNKNSQCKNYIYVEVRLL